MDIAAYIDTITVGSACHRIDIYNDAAMRAAEECGDMRYEPEPEWLKQARVDDKAAHALARKRGLVEAWFYGDRLYLRDGRRETWFRGSAIDQAGGRIDDDYVQHLAREFAGRRRKAA